MDGNKAISLCVSTRAAGFGAAHLFNAISGYKKCPNAGTIYQYYRFFLAILERKVKVVDRNITVIQDNEDDYAELHRDPEFITLMKGVSNLPDQITYVANAIGEIKTNGKIYIPKFGRNNFTTEGLFIPQSEQVTYSNLRRVVIALADKATPREYRVQFYRNNPIPGAIWNNAPQDPTLANPNEIMPEGYTVSDLANDFNYVLAKIYFLKIKASEYFKAPMSYETKGGKSMLVCNRQGSLRVKDRQPNQELADYYVALRVEGNVEEYYNLERLTYGEQVTGNIALLGEQPNLSNFCYPVYTTRDERLCCEFSNICYQDAFYIKCFSGEDIQNNLYSGVNPDKAISLCVSTRAAGFGAAHLFNVISDYKNCPNAGTIYQYYRLCLAILESKVQDITTIYQNYKDYAELNQSYEFITTMRRVINLPDQITSVANAIREIKTEGKIYIPKFGRNNLTKEGLFIPQSEQVTYSNLRRVVIALADKATPLEYRVQFYRNNPIPGAIWNNAPQDPTLANPNEIMPEGYTVSDLANDIHDVREKMDFLHRKGYEYFKAPMSYETDGGKSMLVCNTQGSLRVKDRQPNQELADYYAALKVEGDVEKYYNLERLTYGEQVTGNIALLGEQPNFSNLRYPVYTTRDERVCCQYSGYLRYISVRNSKYK